MTPGTDMPDTMSGSGWWSDIKRRAGERDTERVLLYDRTRRATTQAWRTSLARFAVPALLPEYLKVLLGSAIGFWLLAWPLEAFLDISRLYTYAVLGLVYSLQATHHKYKLATDPEYSVRRCNCAGTKRDGTESVLRSSASSIGGMPTSIFGVAIYAGLFAMVYSGQFLAAQLLAGIGLIMSAYLANVMIRRVGALCAACINIAALNVLFAYEVMRSLL